jgi:hypothetical protein
MAAFWFKGTNKGVIYSKYAAYLLQSQMVAEAVPESAVCEILNTPETNQDSTNAYCRSVFNFQKAISGTKNRRFTPPATSLKCIRTRGIRDQGAAKRKARTLSKIHDGFDYKIVDSGVGKQNNLGTGRW